MHAKMFKKVKAIKTKNTYKNINTHFLANNS